MLKSLFHKLFGSDDKHPLHTPKKVERFTKRARNVLSLAQAETERLHHGKIEAEHLLLGMIREADGVAGRVLRDLGADYERLETLIRELSRAPAEQPSIKLDLADSVKRSLELAVDEARRMGHHYIGTEHLLLGLMRQSNSVVIEVLKRLNITPEDVRKHTLKVLQEAPVVKKD